MIDLSTILDNVVDLSREIGNFIHRESLRFDPSAIQRKDSFRDLVSYVDKEAETHIIKGIKKLLPGAGILTEESPFVKGSNDYLWIVDPLDGTTNFTHGLPPYAVSIGLAKSGQILLGVVYEVTKKECFYALRGGSAYCNGRKISVSDAVSLHQSILSTGFPYQDFPPDQQREFIHVLQTFIKKAQGIRRIGSAAVDLAYVACGRLDGFFEYRLNAWDVAAGSLIVLQSGGNISDFAGGENFLFGGEICAAGKIHTDMLRCFSAYRNDNGKAF